MKRFVAVIRVGHNGLVVPSPGFAETHHTLLQHSYEQVLPLVASPRRLFVVTPEDLVPIVQKQLPKLPVANILIEPVDRESAAAMALASLILYERHGTIATVFFPAGQGVTNQAAFPEAVQRGIRLAREKQGIVLLGITPEQPGASHYLQAGETVSEHGFRVERFLTPSTLHESRSHPGPRNVFAYTGMFVTSTKILLQELDRYAPDLMGPLRVAFETKTLGEAYGALKKISIDQAVLEHTEKVFVVPGKFALDALGDRVQH